MRTKKQWHGKSQLAKILSPNLYSFVNKLIGRERKGYVLQKGQRPPVKKDEALAKALSK